jgi:predicted HAD superfamily Cof-like phosphohydrolase
MNEEWRMVRDFATVMRTPIGESPQIIPMDHVKLRTAWLMEECQEFEDAADLYDQADALIDIIYLALGGLVEAGTLPDDLFRVVHDANMRKLKADGSHDSVAGKIAKPPGWIPPTKKIKELLDRRAEQGRCISND